MPSATEVIEKVRRGETVRRGAEAFLAAGAIDGGALAALGEAVRTTPEPEREGLVRLLVAVGREADPLRPQGGRLIRDPGVIALLVTPSLQLPGGGRDQALDALEGSVPAERLRPFHAAIVEELEKRPGAAVLYLVAKAKPAAARPLLEKLASSPAWGGAEALAIARAALGDEEVAKPLVKLFQDARSPEEKIRLAGVLGRVATPAALAALAGEMRTDLVQEMPSVMKRSVRLDVMGALARSYPDRTFLWSNAIGSDEDYARVEAFCEKEFGTRWTKPRPPYLAVQGFPSSPPP